MNTTVLEEKLNHLLYIPGDTEDSLELKRNFFIYTYLGSLPPVILLTILTYSFNLGVPVLKLYGWMLLSHYLVSGILFLIIKKHVLVFYYFQALAVMSMTFFIVIKQGGLLYSFGILFGPLSIIVFSFVFESIRLAIVLTVYYVIGILVISLFQPWLTPSPEMVEGNNNLIFTTLNSIWISVYIILMIYYIFRKKSEKIKIKNQELSESMERLKATQAQLIQSEKMASLGELTAGIAHEIQNPLNFVNNFSEVNLDLIHDLKSEIQNNNPDEVNALATDIESNSEKINHHGKRAGEIVKSMLEHSRRGSGQKESTDINALCDEYLRLAYHGLRVKNKSFNTIPLAIGLETNFDPTLPKLNVIPQDIARVMLNIINNAFYAVTHRRSKGDDPDQPTVWVSTKNLGDKIEISVKDNGNGIPDSIREKIFQPFFTTKPTGEGAGLGLSLSYDIIKANGGTIDATSAEGGGAIFTVRLPV